MNIQDIISSFKEHQLQYGLNGDNNQQELYKWELITKQAGLLDTEAENFEEGIRKLKFKNLCFYSQVTAFRNLAKYATEDYKNAMRELLNESVDLQQRIGQFISTCETLWDSSVKNNFEGSTKAMCDERIISCFLSLKYPQKYTFYKDRELYGNLCKILGVEKRNAGEKLVHYYELINQIIPEIEKDKELIDSINKELDSKGYIHSMPLIAQTILWCNACKNKKEDKNEFRTKLIKELETRGYFTDDNKGKNLRKDFIWTGKEGTRPDQDIHYELCFSNNKIVGHDGTHCFAEIHIESIKKGNKQYFADELSKRLDLNEIQSFEWQKGIPNSGFRMNENGVDINDPNAIEEIMDDFENLYAFTHTAVAEAKALNKTTNAKPMKEIEILKQKKQIILQGAPGTGKTYKTAEIAVKLCDPDFVSGNREELMKRYKELVSEKRIAFTTFHQSMDYEEFVEGIKPITEDNEVFYEVRKGIFRQICDEAEKNKTQNYVLIIDEINRANISKVLGELITLLEADKRIGETNEVKVKLPYSNDEFGVPANLYIIGTMNTADRSVGYIDYAIRRRFAFITVRADDTIIKNPTARSYFEKVKGWMKKDNIIGDIEPEDLMVGHSYFLAEDEEKLKNKMLYEVIPLLREYISDGILNADIRDDINKWEKELDPEKNN